MGARDADSVREQVVTDAALFDDTPPLTRGQIGATVGVLNKYLGGDQYRYLVCAWLFAVDDNMRLLTSKTMTNGQQQALYRWCGWDRDEQGAWRVDDALPVEAALVLREAIRAYCQLTNTKRAALGLTGLSDLQVTAVAAMGGAVTAVSSEEGQTPDDAIREIEQMVYGEPRKQLRPEALRPDEPLEGF